MVVAIVVAFITALPPTIVALLNFFQGQKIHVLVNSNLTAVKTDLVLANERIVVLQKLVQKLTEGK